MKWFTSKRGPTDLVKGMSLGLVTYLPLLIIIICIIIFVDFSIPTFNYYWLLWVVPIAIIGLLIFYRKKVPGKTYLSNLFKGVTAQGIGSWVAYALILTVSSVILWNQFRKSISTHPVTTQSVQESTSARAGVHEILQVNTPQLLKKGVPYAWDRKCKTIYYFEPVEIGSATLKYAYRPNKNLSRTTTILRNEHGPDFVPLSGKDPMIDGPFIVTVDTDIMVYVRTKYVGN